MHPIVALWTYPRTISTAMERVMIERGDFQVLHEPFSYLYYVHEGASAITQEYEDPDHPRTYPEIRDYILKTAEEGPVFFKDMCAHCYEHLAADDAFLVRLTNTFLIRDPAKTIASFYALNPEVKLEEIGVEQVMGILRKVLDLKKNSPAIHQAIIDADDLEDNPEGTVKAYCDALGIPFIREALYWDAGHKQEWDIWKEWHKDAAQSTGIQKNMETFEVTVENSEHLKAYYDDQIPFYREMYKRRLTPVAL